MSDHLSLKLMFACRKDDRKKTVQNETRLQSDQGLHCLLFGLHLLVAIHQCKVKVFTLKCIGTAGGAPPLTSHCFGTV